MSFWSELRRRHLIKIAIGYVAVGFAVVEAAVLFLPAMSVPDWTYNLVVTLVLIGFPIALVLGWALAMNPAGELERVRPAPPVADGEEPGDAASVVASIRQVSERSIAVLPFADLSPGSDSEYFSDGITEEILTVLSRVRRLDVISRTSVMRYKGSPKGIVEIADELKVAHVLEGSVRRHGDRVRITAQLIDARTDRHLWAETYDRDLDDIFAIQSEVAERIARSLRGAITPDERARIESRPTDSVEAYQWFLKGRQLLAKRSGESIPGAIDAFDRALEQDPEFALAWAHRAEALALLPLYAGADVEESAARARRSARRALEIDPILGEPHAALGMAARILWEWDEAEREFRRALELAPGYPTARHWYGLSLKDRRQYDEAIVELERALELDPLSLPLHLALGLTHHFAGRYDEAKRVYDRALEFEPRSPSVHLNRAGLFQTMERYEESIEAMEAGARLNPEWVPPDLVREVRAGYEAGGATGFWEAYLEGLRTRPDLIGSGPEMALALIRLGRLGEAMEAAERAFDGRDPFADQIIHDPKCAPLRAHPRYPALAARVAPK